jgi:hypothetical protein
MITFSEKVRLLAFSASNGYCQCSKGCTKKANQAHHLLANTKVNRKLYPLFTQSIFNLCPINNDCHLSNPLPRVSEGFASVAEKYLQELKGS